MILSWIQLGSLFMFLGVAMGIFGTHSLSSKLSNEQLDYYKNAVAMQLFHSLALFIVAWLTTQSSDPKVQFAGVCFISGILFYSGMLYLFSITEFAFFKIISSLGSLVLLAGWILLIYSRYCCIF
jgi:uncharacterized membrane protein YgdD (TMEM256/DUF423 family)